MALEEEKKEQELKNNEIELQAFKPMMSFRNRLEQRYEEKIVTVEFKCNGFMKKATGCLHKIGSDFVELYEFKGKKVKIEIYGSGNGVFTEYAEKIIIPLENVCAVELKSPPDHCPEC